MGILVIEDYGAEGEKTMNFWDRVTGSDIRKELRSFDSRAKKLPPDYQEAWDQIKANLWPQSDFTGRNLMPILDGVLGLLEETAADGQSVQEVLGDDIKGFCAALIGDKGALSFRDKWRKQLNNNVTRNLANRRMK
jgi:DNA-binding ferritin-like protein (Dps family)